MSEDSNGQGELTSVCLLVSEDANSICWMVDVLKKRSADWKSIQAAMADKDIKEQDIVKQCLPNASVLICLFHTLCSFQREVSQEKMGFTSGQRTLALNSFRKWPCNI